MRENIQSITHRNDKLHVITAASFTMSPEFLFPQVHPEDIEKYFGSEENREKISLPIHVVLVEKNSRKILIGTGKNPGHGGQSFLLQALEDLNIKVTEITDIVLQSGDNNHIGGIFASDEGLSFPNAKIHMSRAEYKAWEEFTHVQHEKWGYVTFASTLFTQHKNTLVPFDNKKEIISGVSVSASGSTRNAKIFIDITLGSKHYFHIGDLFIHPIHIAHPEWHTAIEQSSTESTTLRQKITTMSLENPDVTLLATHLSTPGLGKIVESGNEQAWQLMN